VQDGLATSRSSLRPGHQLARLGLLQRHAGVLDVDVVGAVRLDRDRPVIDRDEVRSPA
jgi:hypothetical protein